MCIETRDELGDPHGKESEGKESQTVKVVARWLLLGVLGTARSPFRLLPLCIPGRIAPVAPSLSFVAALGGR